MIFATYLPEPTKQDNMSSTQDTIPYHAPWVISEPLDIAITSVNKTFVFDFTADIVAEAKVVFTFQGRTVQEYTVGNGIVLSNANRTATLTLSGADFQDLEGNVMKAYGSFIQAGDIEVEFTLTIVESPL